jgi:hypothetical protein
VPIYGDDFSRRYSVIAETRRCWNVEDKRRLLPRLRSQAQMFQRWPAGMGSSQAFCFAGAGWRKMKGRLRLPGQCSCRFLWRPHGEGRRDKQGSSFQ